MPRLRLVLFLLLVKGIEGVEEFFNKCAIGRIERYFAGTIYGICNPTGFKVQRVQINLPGISTTSKTAADETVISSVTVV